MRLGFSLCRFGVCFFRRNGCVFFAQGPLKRKRGRAEGLQGPSKSTAEPSLPQEDPAQTGSCCEGRQQAVKLVRLSQIEETSS